MHNVPLSKQIYLPVKNKRHKKRPKKPGRPKGYSLKRFDQTRIGFLLAHEVPLEYKLLMETVKTLKLGSPSAELIEAIAYSSNDPLFRKTKFWRCLKDYKKYGLRPPYAVETNINKELYYIRIRFKKYLL